MSSAVSTAQVVTFPEPIVIVGGYGVVGAQIAELLAKRHPHRMIILAGRSGEKARAAAAALPNGRGAVVDVDAVDPLGAIRAHPGLVVSAVNDPANNLMRASIRQRAAYVDIARWTQRLKPAVIEAVALAPRAPVIFASSWMAGVPGLFAAHLAKQFTHVDRIEMSILFALKDKAGPNSVEYADQLGVGIDVLEEGVWKTVRSMSDPRDVTFSGARRLRTRRFATPDLEILPRVTGARSVGVRIAYDDPDAGSVMAFLVRSGLWKAISGPRFEGVRRSMIYHPGPGDSHEVVIEIEGWRAESARTCRLVATVKDPLGQTHMTAVGAVVQIERALGTFGARTHGGGVYYAETHEDERVAVQAMREMGVELQSGTPTF